MDRLERGRTVLTMDNNLMLAKAITVAADAFASKLDKGGVERRHRA